MAISITAMEIASPSQTTRIAAARPSPAFCITGTRAIAKPVTYASTTASAMVAAMPHASATPMARPAASPIVQPIRQWRVACAEVTSGE